MKKQILILLIVMNVSILYPMDEPVYREDSLYWQEELTGIQDLNVNEQLNKDEIVLELHDDADNLIARAAHVPRVFIKKASGLANAMLAIEEQEENPIIALYTKAMCSNQFEALKEIVNQLKKADSLEQAVNDLHLQSNRLIDAIYAANFIGHEELLTILIKTLAKDFEEMAADNKWQELFELAKKLDIPELQSLLIVELKKMPLMQIIQNGLSLIYAPVDIPIYAPELTVFSLGNQWLAATLREILRESIETKESLAIDIWDLANKDLKKNEFVLNRHISKLTRTAISPDGELLIVLTTQGTLEIYQVNTGQLKKILENSMMDPFDSDICFLPDGKRFIINSPQGVFIWDVDSGAHKKLFGCSQNSLSVSKKGNLVAFGTKYANEIVLFNAYTEIFFKKLNTQEPIFAQQLSSDGTLIAYAHENKILVWDISADKAIATFQNNNSSEDTLCFSPDNSLLATSFNDFMSRGKLSYSIKIWEVKTGNLLREIKGEHAHIYAMSFNNDGTQIAYSAKKKHRDRRGFLRIIWLYNFNILENQSLESILLLWNLIDQDQKGILPTIPTGYHHYFVYLPEPIKKYFHSKNPIIDEGLISLHEPEKNFAETMVALKNCLQKLLVELKKNA